jgi:hypothetical protein
MTTAVWHSAVVFTRYGAVKYNIVQYGLLQYRIMYHNIVQSVVSLVLLMF